MRTRHPLHVRHLRHLRHLHPRHLPRLAVVLLIAASAIGAPHELTFEVASRGEAVARITVKCDHCRWDTAGREATVFSIAVDGRYNQHLVALRTGEATYEVLLGA